MNEEGARRPRTAALLESVPGLQSAWFLILAPRYHIPRHRGITKTVLPAHLGLVVPQDRDRCPMQVDRERVSWESGKSFVFDDLYPHEVWNDTDEERVVLIFDFDRPIRLPGRILNRALMWRIERTAYFKDAERNLKDWDQRLGPRSPLPTPCSTMSCRRDSAHMTPPSHRTDGGPSSSRDA
jgi:beta-hydroxylase